MESGLLDALGFDLSDLSIGSALVVIFISWMFREKFFSKALKTKENGSFERVHSRMDHQGDDIHEIKEDIKTLYSKHNEHSRDFSDFKEKFSGEMSTLKTHLSHIQDKLK